MGTTCGEASSTEEEDVQPTKQTPTKEEDVQSTKEALAIQFVLMVCGGVYPAIQPMGTTCGEASSTEGEDGQPTKQTPTEEEDVQSTKEALAIQFVLMVCGGV